MDNLITDIFRCKKIESHKMCTTEYDETQIEIFWSEQDKEFVAIHPQFPLLSYLDPDREQAQKGMRVLLQDVIEDLRS